MSHAIAKRLSLLASLLAMVLVFGKADPLCAQIQVSFKLNKKVYMSHEAVAGRLVITNNAGRDVVLERRNGMSWLDFQVTDSGGNLLSPVPGRSGPGPLVLGSGQTLEKKVYVNQRYPMGRVGMYRVRASVFFPPLGRYFRTHIQSLQVTEGRELWSQTVGVPPGYKGEGTYRKYSVLRFDQQGQKEIYFRLSRADSGLVLTTYSLGKLLMVTDPEMGVDRQNRLHILHMGAPQASAHTVIDVEGKPQPQEFYFAKGENRPRLVRVASGDIVVEGGIPEDMQDSVYEREEFHKLSELPPGMPLNQ